MTAYLQSLAARRRFGMKPGLETMREICSRLGHPERTFRPIHVAGTNGKGAVSAILDACLGGGRYTSPHLLRLNERFFLRGVPLGDAALERAAQRVADVAPADTTFFEALTAVAFQVYAEAQPCPVVFETGLGGRLDATNVCEPRLCVITRIGLEHCDWLGDTIEKIAAEKAGIVKADVPVVLGANEPAVRRVIEARVRAVGAPFVYAPDLADASEIPTDFSLAGAFNRENAVTALAALKTLRVASEAYAGFARVVWPGRFQRVGDCLIDGAHNPAAARALATALLDEGVTSGLILIAGFCGDKAVEDVLSVLAPFVSRAFAVRTNNPRSLSAEETAAKMRAVGLAATACPSLDAALVLSGANALAGAPLAPPRVLVCGSLFLAGEALVRLGAYPWPFETTSALDPSELLNPSR